MRASSDRIFWDALTGREEARDKVVASAVVGRDAGRDDPANAVLVGKSRQFGQVRDRGIDGHGPKPIPEKWTSTVVGASDPRRDWRLEHSARLPLRAG
jgi:hypothetical protein